MKLGSIVGLCAVILLSLTAVYAQGGSTMADGKKILVVYYSKTGNTERVAKDIAGRLGADMEKITDLRKRSGIMGYLYGGRDASKKALTEIGPVTKDPAGYDIVVIGTPIWAWNMTPAVRTYIQQYKDRLKNVAYFATAGGSGLDKTFTYMEELSGKKPVASVGFTASELKNKAKYEEKISSFTATISGK